MADDHGLVRSSSRTLRPLDGAQFATTAQRVRPEVAGPMAGSGGRDGVRDGAARLSVLRRPHLSRLRAMATPCIDLRCAIVSQQSEAGFVES